jgi:hypothetical protein
MAHGVGGCNQVAGSGQAAGCRGALRSADPEAGTARLGACGHPSGQAATADEDRPVARGRRGMDGDRPRCSGCARNAYAGLRCRRVRGHARDTDTGSRRAGLHRFPAVAHTYALRRPEARRGGVAAVSPAVLILTFTTLSAAAEWSRLLPTSQAVGVSLLAWPRCSSAYVWVLLMTGVARFGCCTSLPYGITGASRPDQGGRA